MPKNQSHNEELTRQNLTHYYEEAKQNGMLPSLLACDVSEGAIKTAIRRGKISANMVEGFVQVMGASREALTGLIPLSEVNSAETDDDSPREADEIKEEIDLYIDSLFTDKSLGIPCRRLLRRTIRYIEIFALNQRRRKGDAIESVMLKARGLIDEAYSEVARAFSFEIKE